MQNRIRFDQYIEAAKNGDIETITAYINEDNANEIDQFDSCNNTALAYAASHGHEAIVNLLLHNGASVSVFNGSRRVYARKGNYRSDSTLDLCNVASDGFANIVKRLTEAGAKVNINDEAATPLIYMAKQGATEAVQTLLQQGAQVNATTSDDMLNVFHMGRRWTALMWAAYQGHEDTVKTLLTAENIKLREPNHSGYTALDLAKQRKHENIVRLIHHALLQSTHAGELLDVGNYFYENKKTDFSIQAFKKAIQLNPNLIKAHYNLGVLYRHNELFALAIESFNAACDLHYPEAIKARLEMHLRNQGEPLTLLKLFELYSQLNEQKNDKPTQKLLNEVQQLIKSNQPIAIGKPISSSTLDKEPLIYLPTEEVNQALKAQASAQSFSYITSHSFTLQETETMPPSQSTLQTIPNLLFFSPAPTTPSAPPLALPKPSQHTVPATNILPHSTQGWQYGTAALVNVLPSVPTTLPQYHSTLFATPRAPQQALEPWQAQRYQMPGM